MFRTLINNPIEPIPVEYTNTLNRLENEPDYALTCLGIALMKKRGEYHGISGQYLNLNNLKEALDNFIGAIQVNTNRPFFGYYTYSEDSDDVEDKLNELETKGFKRKESIEKLVHDKASNTCYAFYHEEDNVAAVVINTRDTRLYHLLISFLPLYYPALFKDQPMQPEDYDIVKTLSKNDSGIFTNKIREVMKPYTEEFRRIQLTGLIRQMHEVKVSAAKYDVDNQRVAVDSLCEQYAQAVDTLKNLIVTYEGLKATEQSGENESELIEYLCSTKNITAINIEESTLSFIATSLLTGFSDDAWRSFDERGGIYDGEYRQRDYNFELRDVFKRQENRKKLLNSIFGENPEFSIKMCGYYSLNLHNYRAGTASNYDYVSKDPSLVDYMPNPHLDIHACLGGYRNRVPEAIRSGDLISAVDMCIASAGTVNLDETDITFRPFIGKLMASENKVLRRRDGVDMTPEEALIYLIDKEK